MTDSPNPAELDDLLIAASNLAAPKFGSRDDGLLPFEVSGNELIADPSGIAWWAEEKCLIVSDLHLEKGSSFARRGQMLPPYDTQATLARLQVSLDYWRPKTVISLGDAFHDFKASARLPLAQRQILAAMCRNLNWIWISGNHDPEPPVDLSGMVAENLSISGLHFGHEPHLDAPAGDISGHLHPMAIIRIKGRSIRRRCFVANNSRLIMPSFGTYTGGLNVLDKAFNGLFDGRKFYALMMGDAQIYKFAGKYLRE